MRGGSSFHIDYQNFVLCVYVAGYRTKGESIVILLKEGDRTFYSIVIDSFCIGEEPDVINSTTEILDENGVKALSMLVMSHPHEDHIMGMDKLLSYYCNKETRFYYPFHSFDLDQGLVDLKEEEKRILRIVKQKNSTLKTFSNPVAITVGGYSLLDRVHLYDNDDPEEERSRPIEIVAVTPVGPVNDAKRNNKKLDPNDLSISIMINMSEYYLFFGADTTNAHITHLDKDLMSAVRFVKIPHHASDTADKLINCFSGNQLDFACSTSFYVGQSSLPNKDILDLYCLVSKRVDIIGCPTDDARQGNVGEVCYRFKPRSRAVLTTVVTEGLTNQVK